MKAGVSQGASKEPNPRHSPQEKPTFVGQGGGARPDRPPLRAYATGLLLPGERKSVEPMAARVEPARVGAAHQSLHHFVAAARTISRSSRCRITQAASLS